MSILHGCTPEPLFNKVCYNMVLDITRIRAGPEIAIYKDSFSYITLPFSSQYNTIWIANTENILGPQCYKEVLVYVFVGGCSNLSDFTSFYAKSEVNNNGNS